MKKTLIKLFLTFIFLLVFNNSFADILKKIEVKGNKRISDETIKVYGEIKINKDYKDDDINKILKRLYETNFFSYFHFVFLYCNCSCRL